MSQVFGIDTKLAAYMVGYSITDNNGVVESTVIYPELQQGVITDCGLDQYMMCDGDTAPIGDLTSAGIYPRFANNSPYGGTGCLSYAGYGVGSGSNDSTMTELVSPLGVYNSSIVDIYAHDTEGSINYRYHDAEVEADTYDYWYSVYAGETFVEPSLTNTTGTYFNRETGDVFMQIAHLSEAFQEQTSISEVGIFGAAQNVKYLFSRVLLPTPVTVPAGKCLRTLFRLCLQVSNIVPTENTQFITGWDTSGTHRIEYFIPPTTNTYYIYPDDEYTPENMHTCEGFFCNAECGFLDTLCPDGVVGVQQYLYSNLACLSPLPDSTDDYVNYCALTMYANPYTYELLGKQHTQECSSSTIFRAFCEAWPGFTNSSGAATSQMDTYVLGHKYRDIVYTFGPNWPDNASVSISAIRVRGVTYIFNTPQQKLNTQTLQFTFRMAVTTI